MKKVIVIVGPTASGKTSVSIDLAQKINAEIINGDSVQVYKELNIGSAKIKPDEMGNVKHHLFNIRNAGESYTAFNFQYDVRKLIDEINFPIIVGGTGFYIKAALYNYEFSKEENYNYEAYHNLTNQEIYKKLITLDPKLTIDINNRVRLVRAYHLALNQDLRSSKKKKDEPLYNILTIYLDLDRKVLKDRLVKRLDIMLEEGFILEVDALLKKGISLNIIGYRELASYLKGEISLDEAKDLIIRSSMKLAKKQKTWFLNQMNSTVFNALSSNLNEEIMKVVEGFINE